ncbi:hypothetical protein RchiOBHm_Chr2g0088611 [Rosa chinensis]|uniref:Uncharacterized protein n=1 Tax=Rosa chinensis TaxID=74649 RepID=A0A2P6RIX4_ROSCH|nr:hypothetical protein RchiOBHm_Chr2g0088611 [Rosa chinensis]
MIFFVLEFCCGRFGDYCCVVLAKRKRKGRRKEMSLFLKEKENKENGKNWIKGGFTVVKW